MREAASPFADRPVAGLGLAPKTAAGLARRFRLCPIPGEFDPATEVLAIQKGMIDEPLLEKLPALRLVATSAAGFDGLDFDLLKRRGIALSNRANSRDVDVADLVFGLLIATVRHIAASDQLIRSGQWAAARFQHEQRVTGRRLGIYGMGRIGDDVAKRAAGFDLEIGYHNRHSRPDIPHRYFPSLLELAGWCDFLVIATPLDATTRHSVDRAVLEAVGPQGAVINIARGAVIEEAALIAALQSRALGSAGLDVFEDEPNVPKALTELTNIVMTPHVGGFTVATQADALAALIANIENYFRNGRPLVVAKA